MFDLTAGALFAHRPRKTARLSPSILDVRSYVKIELASSNPNLSFCGGGKGIFCPVRSKHSGMRMRWYN
ncbi:hypothetical protein EMEDMD4_100124 [Sinorhizobium medicae]|uniref:Uncharacterized protein n=1 Tax=Sinorhizobium medicae TaxID=110321 RepID=A0A508WQR3_9HYPH|nr:hypothetical protein EMEDMD4_100124 [Sinorhizobium medicae]